MELDLLHPRQSAREAIKKSVSDAVWEKNQVFVKKLSKYIETHPLMKHPLIAAMNEGKFEAAAIRHFHLEFGHAFAQIFTDAMLRAMVLTGQVEARLGPKGKMAPRFLLQLNMLDELGLSADVEGATGWAGHPLNSHYVKFHETLEQLGVSHKELLQYHPSPYAMAARHTFESCYEDYTLLTCVLACAESLFDVFAGPWARNTSSKTKVKVDGGYHSIHVLDESGHGIDDDHSEDMWFVFCQALTPERHDEVWHKAMGWIGAWDALANSMASKK